MAWTPDVTTSGIFATLVLQAIIGVVVYSLFECMRSQREVYWPKKRTRPERCPKSDPSKGMFGWLTSTMAVSEEETLRLVGMDGYMMLRFIRMCATALLTCGTFALIFLLPVYGTAIGDQDVVGYDRYTIANITAAGDRLWAPWICCYIFSFIFLYQLHKEYEVFARLRRQFLVQGDPELPKQHLCAVVAENIPPKYQSSVHLKTLFEELFPGQVLHAEIGLNTAHVDELAAQRKALLGKLEKAVAAYEAGGRKDPPMVSVKNGEVVMCGGTEKVEAIPYYIRRVVELNDQIKELKVQKNVLSGYPAPRARGSMGSMGSMGSDFSPRDGETKSLEPEGASPVSAGYATTLPVLVGSVQHEVKDTVTGGGKDMAVSATGFVTFRSALPPSVAFTAPLLSERYPDLRAMPAPTPDEVIWRNVGAPLPYIRMASFLTSALLYTGLLFWGAILAFISAISSLSNLEAYLPFLTSLDPVSYSILEGQLPVIVLIIFISLLPTIFAYIATSIERRKTVTEVRMQVFFWFFLYQLANVYLILLAGSLFGALADAISNPSSVVTLIANALPGVSAFFLNVLITLLLSGVPLNLLRIAPMAIYKLYRSCFNEKKLTRRDLIEGPLAEVWVDYATTLPGFLYVLAIALTYWVIAPIVVFTAGLLFAANYAVYKYQLLYVYVSNHETGGLYFFKVYKYSMVALMASAIMMLIYLAIKEGAAQAPLLVPLPLIIYGAWCFTEMRFRHLSLALALDEVTREDQAELGTLAAEASRGDNKKATANSSVFESDFYTHPALRGDTDLSPEVYRVLAADETAVPLIKANGNLNDAYNSSTTITLEDLGAAELYPEQVGGFRLSDSAQQSPMRPGETRAAPKALQRV